MSAPGLIPPFFHVGTRMTCMAWIIPYRKGTRHLPSSITLHISKGPSMNILSTSLTVFLSIVLVWAYQRLLDYWKAIRSIGNHPGYRTLLPPKGVLANVFSAIPGIAPGKNHVFVMKHKAFEYFGWDIISLVSIWPRTVALSLADAEAIKEVTMSRSRFPKPVDNYAALTLFGQNILASEGEEWKRYRKIAAPAFSDRNNKLVWNETVQTIESLLRDVWQHEKIVAVDNFLDVTLPIALFIIGAAGFGREVSWKGGFIPPGHQLTLENAWHIVTTNIFLKASLPDFVMGLTKKRRDILLGFHELERYMQEMVDERLESQAEGKHDLFSSLLEASNEETEAVNLTVKEVIGNMFVFIFAGHETTAHTLCFAFALLALYQDEQERLYQHIKSVLSDRSPTYEDMPSLTYSMAVFYETLRLYPPAISFPKRSAEDTILTASNQFGQKKIIPVPKGTDISINIAGLHYNPRYWTEPYSFKPSRFLGDWPRDAFVPFSAGARACLGRKFAETEAMAVLTILVSQYKIKVKEEQRFANETFEERKARILSYKRGATLVPIRVPLTFERRN